MHLRNNGDKLGRNQALYIYLSVMFVFAIEDLKILIKAHDIAYVLKIAPQIAN